MPPPRGPEGTEGIGPPVPQGETPDAGGYSARRTRTPLLAASIARQFQDLVTEDILIETRIGIRVSRRGRTSGRRSRGRAIDPADQWLVITRERLWALPVRRDCRAGASAGHLCLWYSCAVSS
jgi:hypothetical protein